MIACTLLYSFWSSTWNITPLPAIVVYLKATERLMLWRKQKKFKLLSKLFKISRYIIAEGLANIHKPFGYLNLKIQVIAVICAPLTDTILPVVCKTIVYNLLWLSTLKLIEAIRDYRFDFGALKQINMCLYKSYYSSDLIDFQVFKWF